MTDLQYIIDQLQINRDIFSNMLSGNDPDFIKWKQSPDSWCLLEILCHLIDEEQRDFRFRTNFILENPGKIPPPFNPMKWVEDHSYMEQDYESKKAQFLDERDHSISWLKSLNEPCWDNYFVHPKLGKMTAGYYLNNWLAHDYLHMKQITKRKFDYLKHKTGHNLDYAGIWK